jgi:IS1 family transposase
MNRLDPKRRAQVVAALVEGNSVRATVRMTGVAKNTIQKLLLDLGSACADYMDEHFHKLPCRRVQCDEIWSFIAAKAKNVTPELRKKNPYAGDAWTWVAIDADTKLVCSFAVGGRDAGMAHEFISDLASRLRYRVQLTTDGHKPYLQAVEDAFGSQVDYAMLVKLYGQPSDDERRYSPAKCIGAICQTVTGDPSPKHISTSYVERQNLTVRMSNRRFTRLTNAFSKKIDNHMASLALHYMHYNFCRVHQSLRITPAMEAGLTEHVWSIAELVGLLKQR